ncbi:MAG: DUF3810 domain-containing protein [Ruminococcaceae bacterium]|nr:DUF3810 domain-containing protein [Oscillospiraceae bacterium]
MKYWRGYLTAAILGVFTWVLIQMGQKYTTLVDMVYPYVTRSVQSFLTAWTGGFDFLVWQTAVIFLVITLIATLVLVFIFRAKVVRWLGWALAAVMAVVLLHTGIYGLNSYAGPIEDDLRLDMVDYTQSELENAAIFYRDQANALAARVQRDENGQVLFSEFAALAEQTGSGYRKLARENSFSVYGGDYTPVKELGWAGIYSALGKTGVTVALTGEAAVNPNIPDQGIPFAMAHEMAHRLCIARDDEANFSAFLACSVNENVEYQYSAYFMAYRFCIAALQSVDMGAAETIASGCSETLRADVEGYDRYFDENRDEQMTMMVSTVTDTYAEATAESEEIRRSSVCDYLVNWHIDQYVEEEVVEQKFDPLDETQVDLSGLVNADAKPQEEPAE